MVKIKILSIVGVVCFSLSAWSSSGESSGDGGEASADKASGSDSRESIEYRKKSTKLESLRGKVGELELTFKERAETLAKTGNRQQQSEIAKELVTLASDRNVAVDKYMKLKSELQFRYPNQGEALFDKYLPLKRKSTDEMGVDSGLSEKLDITFAHIMKKYQKFIRKAEKEKKQRMLELQSAEKQRVKKKKRKRLRLVQ